MEYSKDINSLLGSLDAGPDPVIDDPKMVLKVKFPGFDCSCGFPCYISSCCI